MRNLLQFLIKYSNLLLFIVLEVAALVLLLRNNNYPRSVYSTSANIVSGSLYTVSNSVLSYVYLGSENESLSEENALLKERIMALENQLESYSERDSSALYIDCARYQYAHKGLKFVPAKVINVQTKSRHNYFTLNKGLRDGVEQDMGVVGPSGAVGIVMAVSERFSVVLPLVNDRMSLSCRFKKDNTIGPLEWDGVDVRYASLENIARHAEVHVGDTIVTSGLTSAFPEGVMVGVVEEATLEESDAYYQIKVRMGTDFQRIGYVQVISNEALREQRMLEDY
ncbi:MAG: rod shape-determining protein MreC [Paludibacteraceae bacterium]|nr:rod shape-determining protein MreC [Paludibacteraceae bacterium]